MCYFGIRAVEKEGKIECTHSSLIRRSVYSRHSANGSLVTGNMLLLCVHSIFPSFFPFLIPSLRAHAKA